MQKNESINEIRQLQEEISTLRQQIDALYASRSWRLTAPIRWLSRRWIAIKQGFNNVKLITALRRAPLLGPVLVRREIIRRYSETFGFEPKLNPPVKFNEHIIQRILFDRDPRLKIVCDKIAVRDFIRDRVGERYVVPTLGIWENPRQIPWNDMPDRFVLKPNHASGPFELVPPPPERDIFALTIRAEQWLAYDYFDVSLEWGYKDIPKRLIAQPLLLSPSGECVMEVDIFVFHGQAALIHILKGQKLTSSRQGCWLDATGKHLAFRSSSPYFHGVLEPNLRLELVQVAESVAKDFTSMRVDFYLTGDGLKIGELTPYNFGGKSVFKPPEMDEVLGSLWDLPLDLSVLPRFQS